MQALAYVQHKALPSSILGVGGLMWSETSNSRTVHVLSNGTEEWQSRTSLCGLTH